MKNTKTASIPGPSVAGSSGGGSAAPADGTYITATDQSGTLTNSRELRAGEGLDERDDGPAGNFTLSADVTEIRLPVINDDFTSATLKPFWQNTDMFTSGDWEFDAVNDRLNALLQNNAFDAYREGIEGDADHIFKYYVDGSDAPSIYFEGNGLAVRAQAFDGDVRIEATGKADIITGIASWTANPFTLWVRLVRTNNDFTMYYRLNDYDQWLLVGTQTDLDLGPDMKASQKSCLESRILRAIIFDNSRTGSAIKAKFVKEIALTDAASIAVDASLGNLFTITLGGSRTLANPSNPKRGQMIVFRIKQDGTGSRTLTFDTKYRFSTDIPSPTLSAGAGDEDYLGFIYNSVADTWDCIGKVFGF